jgi:hypothetical protein
VESFVISGDPPQITTVNSAPRVASEKNPETGVTGGEVFFPALKTEIRSATRQT